MTEDLRDKKYSSILESVYPAKPESVELDEYKQLFMNKTENDSKLKLKKDKKATAPFPPLQRKKPRRDDDQAKMLKGAPEFRAKGGRAGYRSGGRGCKLAMKGKGRAYGKNS